jgi:hypothetical protein
MNADNQFPILYARRITNTREFKDVLVAVMADVIAGRITPKEANAINRKARDILKTVQAVVSLRKLGQRASKQYLVW